VSCIRSILRQLVPFASPQPSFSSYPTHSCISHLNQPFSTRHFTASSIHPPHITTPKRSTCVIYNDFLAKGATSSGRESLASDDQEEEEEETGETPPFIPEEEIGQYVELMRRKRDAQMVEMVRAQKELEELRKYEEGAWGCSLL
jgi:hypothetical protein